MGCPEYRSWINLEEVLSKLGLGSLGVIAVKISVNDLGMAGAVPVKCMRKVISTFVDYNLKLKLKMMKKK